MAAHWQSAEVALAAGDVARAQRELESVLALDPSQPLARLRLSVLALGRSELRAALTWMEPVTAASRWPAEVVLQLSRQLIVLGESERAATLLQALRERLPATAAAWAECGHQWSLLGQQLAARAILLHALTLPGGDNLGLRYTLGTVHAFCGEDADAATQFETCIARKPDFERAHWALSKLRDHDAGQRAQRIERLRRLAASLPRTGAELHAALFNELDADDRVDEAWSALMASGALRRRELPFDDAAEVALFAALERWVPAATTTARSECDHAPIFVTGLPRSGTTLVERMLGNHPAVGSAGELVDVSMQLQWLSGRAARDYVDSEVLTTLPSGSLVTAGERYLNHTAWRIARGQRLLDKMPANSLLLPQIAAMLPAASLVLVERDPRDTAFSNLKELFGRMYRYSYDQATTARHVLRHRRLMRHYRSRLGDRLIEVDYESLVAQPEPQAAALFARCGLDFQPGYADIRSNNAPSSTASAVQVRAAVSDRHIGQWRRYERHLGPMLEILARGD